MFSRTLARTARQIKPTTTTFTAARAFQASARYSTPPPPESVHERRVPVTHYNKGVREQEILEVNEANEGPVSSSVGDEKSVAQPLNPAVVPQLTPTLARFTLQDKVAIVTG